MRNNSPSQQRYRAKRSAARYRKSAVEFDFYKRRIGELCEQFPEAFNKRFPLPLSIGIHHQLLESTQFTEKEISALLKVWVNRWEYKCMATSVGRRFDIFGVESGWIHAKEMNGFIKETVRLRPQVLRIFCKRYLKKTGRPALICIPVGDRPELEIDHESE